MRRRRAIGVSSPKFPDAVESTQRCRSEDQRARGDFPKPICGNAGDSVDQGGGTEHQGKDCLSGFLSRATRCICLFSHFVVTNMTREAPG